MHTGVYVSVSLCLLLCVHAVFVSSLSFTHTIRTHNTHSQSHTNHTSSVWEWTLQLFSKRKVPINVITKDTKQIKGRQGIPKLSSVHRQYCTVIINVRDTNNTGSLVGHKYCSHYRHRTYTNPCRIVLVWVTTSLASWYGNREPSSISFLSTYKRARIIAKTQKKFIDSSY